MGSKKSTSETKPWKKAQPYILGAADTLQGTYNTQAPKITQATDSITSLLPGMIEKYQQGDSGINAARGYNTDVLSGNYLGSNPYLDQTLMNSNDDIRNQMQAAMGAKGLTGGSSYADLISRNIAKNTLATRYQDYDQERQRMATAAGQSPSIAAGDAIQVAPMLSTLQASLTPMQAAQGYAGTLGGLFAPYTQTTQTQGGGVLGSLLSAGAQLGSAAIMASERRVKRDIVKIGAEPDGLGVYRYNYVWDEPDVPVRAGVMVDEVQALRPWALGPVVNGIQTVDYGRL